MLGLLGIYYGGFVMETKFTKGEWSIGSKSIFPEVGTESGLFIHSHTNEYAGVDFDESMANAHLIASAPAMYKELELHLIAWENMYPSDISYVGDMHAEEFKAIHKFINGTKELLAKARGES